MPSLTPTHPGTVAAILPRGCDRNRGPEPPCHPNVSGRAARGARGAVWGAVWGAVERLGSGVREARGSGLGVKTKTP
jgi:hypothetical protein